MSYRTVQEILTVTTMELVLELKTRLSAIVMTTGLVRLVNSPVCMAK